MAWAPNYPGKSDLSAYLRTYGGEVVAAYNLHTTVKDKLRAARAVRRSERQEGSKRLI